MAIQTLYGSDSPSRSWSELLPEELPAAERFYEEVVHRAAELNSRILAQRAREDVRYQHKKNTVAPKKIKSHLAVFDCINCDKCIPACPNDAMFVYEVRREDRSVLPDRDEDGPRFRVEKTHQLAVLADWCNECGNCDTYCPEHGGPFREKPNFYRSLDDLQAERRMNSYCHVPAHHPGAPERLHAWIRDREYCLEHCPGEPAAILRANGIDFALSWPDGRLLQPPDDSAQPGEIVGHLEVFHRLRVLLEGIPRGERVNTLNAASPFPPPSP